MELGAEFLLEANAHFSDLLVNTTLSSVQLPTNVYNKGARRTRPGEQMGLPGQGRKSAGVDGLTAGNVLSSVCMCVCTYIQQMKADLISPAFPPHDLTL